MNRLFTIWCAGALMCMTGMAQAQSTASRSDSPKNAAKLFVVAIGVSNYADEFWTPLKFPVADARTFASRVGENTGMDSEVFLLTNEDASRDKVIRTLSAIAKRAKSDDVIVVYVSAHGTLIPAGSGELEQAVVLSASGRDDVGSTGLPHDVLLQSMDRIGTRRKLVILATCHSGLGKSRLAPRVQELLAGTKGTRVTIDQVSEGTLLLAASAKGETAREDEKLGGDIYTHFFLEGLKVNDRNRDGAVSALEAHDYARDRTWTFTKGKQRPTVDARLIGDADVPLVGRRSGKGLPVLEAWSDSFRDFSVRVNGGTKGRLPTGLPMRSGNNLVELIPPGTDPEDSNARSIKRFNVAASNGERVTLEEIVAPQPWRVGGGLQQTYFRDRSTKRLLGSGFSNDGFISAERVFTAWSVGVELSTNESRTREIAPSLRSKTDMSRALVTTTWTLQLPHSFTASAELGAGWVLLKNRISDDETSIAINADGFSSRVGAEIGLKLPSNARFFIGAGYRSEILAADETNLIDRKTIDIGGHQLRFGVQFPLGGKARPL